MATTRVFKSGNSQAVKLPKEFSIKGKVVEILRRGDEIVLREPGKGLERAFELLTELPDDFFPKDARTRPLSIGRGCDGGAVSAGYLYLHLHPTPTAAGSIGAFSKTETRRFRDIRYHVG